MDRLLNRLQESPGPSQQPASLGACSFSASAAASGLPLSHLVWRALGFNEDQGGETCCPMRGLGCDVGSSQCWGPPLLKLRACVLSCLVITPLVVEFWEAGFGVEVSHGLLLA